MNKCSHKPKCLLATNSIFDNIFIQQRVFMPFEMTLENSGVYYKMLGTVTSNDIGKLDRELHSLESFSSLKYLIIDYTHADEFRMSESEVTISAAVGKAAAITNPRLVIAVVSQDENIINALQVYDNYRGGHPWKTSLHGCLGDARQQVQSN